jgi:hypothetical protein
MTLLPRPRPVSVPRVSCQSPGVGTEPRRDEQGGCQSAAYCNSYTPSDEVHLG